MSDPEVSRNPSPMTTAERFLLAIVAFGGAAFVSTALLGPRLDIAPSLMAGLFATEGGVTFLSLLFLSILVTRQG